MALDEAIEHVEWCAESKVENDQLKAENAKLRKRLAQYELFECVVGDPSTEFARLRRELHRLQRENAKLRELVKQIETCAVHKGMCRICPMLEFKYGRPPICTSRIGELKRELGFEVDA